MNMDTITNKYSSKAGLPPGSLVHIGEKKSEVAQIKILNYSEDSCEEKSLDINDVSLFQLDKSNLYWISVEGIHDVNILEKLGNYFGIHPLVLEDIMNTKQRPKIENYEEYTFVVVKKLFYDNKIDEFTNEQESFILAENYIISFSEGKTELYNPVRERIKEGVNRFRKMGVDYLLYTLLDVIVDNYFVALEELGDTTEILEDELVSNPSPDTLQAIHKLREQLLYLHKSVWPLREVIGSLERSVTSLVKESTEIYIRDLYDHVIQVMDTTETLRDILSGMLDMYLSSVSNRMNEIMKVLTIISTVFIPLSFIVGLYGMNFKNMPEYNWPWMYTVVWIIIILVATLMLVFFKKKKWW
jgi:magnesium transporter